jgi:IMP dehydrogenase
MDINNKILKEGLTFDDILLLPGYTDFKRRDVDLATILHKKVVLKLPVVSSPMDTVTEEKMALEMAKAGGLGVLHRNLSVEVQAEMVRNIKKTPVESRETASIDTQGRYLVAAAVGIGEDFEERMKALVAVDIDVVVIDSGHGNTKFMVDGVGFIKKNYPDTVVMAGNVATGEGAKTLIKAGADILRIGMGPGAICTTRVVTGMGVPQITAIMEAVEAAKGTHVAVVADGGIKQIGDMAKALGVGANAVMLGSLLARYEESPGEIVERNGKKYKSYRGMGSIAAMKKGGAERYGQSRNTAEKKLIAEGVESLVELKGKVEDFLYQIAGGLRSSFYYIGAKDMKSFQEQAKFVKISNAGLIESHPHDINITNTGGNYFV